MSLETSFKGKHVLISGAARGIGKGVVQRLHEYGAIVYAIARNPDGLKELAKEFPGIKTIAVDLADWNATKKAVESIQEPIQYLINNAAVLITESFLEITPEAFDETFSTNLKSVINVSQIVAKQMINNGIQGSILNVSSIAAKRAMPMVGTYSASKAALDSLTATMALELGKHKIRVNSINLAGVETDMSKGALADVFTDGGRINAEQATEAFLARIPMGEVFIEMKQVVNAILFATSDLVRMFDGQTFVVDGGFLIG